MSRVTYYVDGKWRRTFKAAGRTVSSLRVNPLKQRTGAHRITAKVRFTQDSGTKARTLRLSYRRCEKPEPVKVG